MNKNKYINNKIDEYLQNTKENALHNYIVMTKNSWTYARLTAEEKERLMETFEWCKYQKMIKGTLKQRWDILHLIYASFLNALDYKPIGWREN